MEVIDTAPLENSLGFLALGAYILTLMPTNLRIIFPQTKQANLPKWLLKYRRIIGILAFCLALLHAFLLVKKRDLDFLDPNTYWIYIQGISGWERNETRLSAYLSAISIVIQTILR